MAAMQIQEMMRLQENNQHPKGGNREDGEKAKAERQTPVHKDKITIDPVYLKWLEEQAKEARTK